MTWRELQNVEGNLINLIKQVGHEPTKISNGKLTYHISKRGSKYEVKMYGEGGGYFNTEVWNARRTKKQIERHQTENIEFKRP